MKLLVINNFFGMTAYLELAFMTAYLELVISYSFNIKSINFTKTPQR